MTWPTATREMSCLNTRAENATMAITVHEACTTRLNSSVPTPR